MGAPARDLKTLLDREQVRDCVVRLARGEDRRDANAIRSCFWPDAKLDFGIFAGDFAAYLDWVTPGSPAIPMTQHFLGQTLIESDGARARAETHVIAVHRVNMGAEERDILLGGRYLDRLELRGEEWRIASRTMLYDWTQDVGVAADWSKGLMGSAFSAAHFSGRAMGDFSEAFFAGER